MNIGSLNKRVTLQYRSWVTDNMLGRTETWNDAATVWCAIWPTSAKEQVQAMQMSMTVTHRIRMRYRKDIKGSWRIKYHDKYFSVVSIIDPNMAHEYLDVLCREGQA